MIFVIIENNKIKKYYVRVHELPAIMSEQHKLKTLQLRIEGDVKDVDVDTDISNLDNMIILTDVIYGDINNIVDTTLFDVLPVLGLDGYGFEIPKSPVYAIVPLRKMPTVSQVLPNNITLTLN